MLKFFSFKKPVVFLGSVVQINPLAHNHDYNYADKNGNVYFLVEHEEDDGNNQISVYYNIRAKFSHFVQNKHLSYVLEGPINQVFEIHERIVFSQKISKSSKAEILNGKLTKLSFEYLYKNKKYSISFFRKGGKIEKVGEIPINIRKLWKRKNL